METTEIIYVVCGAFLVLLPVLKVVAKKTDNVIDDKILTLLAGWAKKVVGK